jgi:hypothetical protein
MPATTLMQFGHGAGVCNAKAQPEANSMVLAQFLAIVTLLVSASVMAAPPQLYRHAAYESPVRGDPDDLLLIAGYGLAADDTVVYTALADTTKALAPPSRLPTHSGADIGVASIVSSADVPYSLTIKLPQDLRPDQSYALWVRTAHGEWSKAVTINDARPLWVSPVYIYARGSVASLPRELKIVGRNLQPSPGHSTRIRLMGPQQFTGTADSSGQSSETLNNYVARVRLPAYLAQGSYRIQISRDTSSWVDVEGQLLEVLPDPRPAAQFSVSDPQFGGCRPDDDADDTPCIVRAIAAAKRAGGGAVYFGPGTWDLIDSGRPGLVPGEGILVAAGVQLRGAGNTLTRLQRHTEWNARMPTAAFTLAAHTIVSGFTLRDLQVYQPSNHAGAFLQIGEDWQRVAAAPGSSAETAVVTDVTITRNVFDKPDIAIGVGGVPISRLFITYNVFGAYSSALELGGDQFNMIYPYRLDDSIIDYNVFKPGSKLDLIQKTGTIASELGAGRRVDFSGNTADGASTDYLYAADDARGWRAAFFWSPNNNLEEVLVSQNTATCTGDKIGDGEAISFDNNLNTFAFGTVPTVVQASAADVTVSAPIAARQNNREVHIASYYIGHWVQIAGGPGLGQARKIIGYATDPVTHLTTFKVAPEWDVIPIPGRTRIAIGREYWQVYTVDNQVDNRQPLCQKSNRSRHVAGLIGMWAQSADSVIAGNHQYDSDGIFIQQNYIPPEHACIGCTMQGYFHSFLEIRANVVDGEYDWTNDCSASGIMAGVATAAWADVPPPTVGFGISISHNTIRRADGLHGGAIGQVDSWAAGPDPHRWPLSESMLIHHNSISDIDGARAIPICGTSRPRVGIAFPDPPIAWRTVLYANSCKNVSTPVGGGGIDTIKVCPSSAPDSCECPRTSR